MAKKPFSISDYLAPELVSKPDTPQAGALVEIPLGDISASERNFYDTSDVAELVKSIELNGLIEPIIVRRLPEGGYRIISGHRRYKAVCVLHAEDPGKWATITAIIREPKDDIVEELLLIEANRANRVLSSADVMRQAERYKELLVELKNQGVEIPGRLRDAVAEAMQISATRLARLDVIRKSLIPEWMDKFEAGKLNESAAYEMARCPARTQQLMVGMAPTAMTAEKVASLKRYANDCCEKHECRADASQSCDHAEGFWRAGKGIDSYYSRCVPGFYTSRGKCCADCKKADKCPHACPKALPVRQAEQAENRRVREEAEKREQAKETRENKAAGKKWTALVTLLEAAGMSREAIASSANCSTAGLQERMDGKFSHYSWGKFPEDVISLARYKALSKASGLSINKLLGMKNADKLTDESDPAPEAPAGWRSLDDDPPPDGQLLVLRVYPGLAGERLRPLIRRGDGWASPYHEGLPVDINTSPGDQWTPLPEREERNGS